MTCTLQARPGCVSGFRQSGRCGATVAPPPDLSARPLVWFAPLPRLPVHEGRPYVGADDFIQLFEPDAAWDWLATYRRVSGKPFAFFHLDANFPRNGWVEHAVAIQRAAEQESAVFGFIYNGGAAPSDSSWVGLAGERIHTFEEAAGGSPDHVIFQSWMAHPDRTLPDTEPDTFTGLIVRYFEDRAGLGLAASDNAALRRPTQASRALAERPAAAAVDGDPDTWWGAAPPPPQWLEIDLGEPRDIAEIRLQVSQDPAGLSEHRVYDGSGTLLHTARGETRDGQVLVIRPDTPWSGIRVLRIETVESPSWVAWREVEVVPPTSRS